MWILINSKRETIKTLSSSGLSEGNFDGFTNNGAADAFIVKYDSNGNKQ
jgi:hypothetical protein